MSSRRNCRVIVPKEGEIVLAIPARNLRNHFDIIRQLNNKPAGAPVLVKEFCEYFRCTVDEVYDILGWE